MNSSRKMMRRITMTAAFLGLLTALYLLWQHRFVKIENLPVVTLHDLRLTGATAQGVEWNGSGNDLAIRLLANEGEQPVVTRFNFPGFPAVEFLHLKFEGSAQNLKPGKEDWEDGRCMIEWRSPEAPGGCEHESFFTARFDLARIVTEMVVKPLHSPAVPGLRLENLGKSGVIEISHFEATAVRQALVWKIGRWLLIGAWLYWGVLWIRMLGGSGMFRVWAASLIWIIMGIYCVIPGPWAACRPFNTPFQIGDHYEITPKHEANMMLPSIQPSKISVSKPSDVTINSIGKIPQKGDITLKIKIYAQKARTLLHVALLFGPTLLIAFLVGRKPACALMVFMSLAIEAAEAAFGFGFDGWDVVDIVCNLSGVGLALLIHELIRKRYPNIIHQ